MPRYRSAYALSCVLNDDAISHISQFEENPDDVISVILSSAHIKGLTHGLEAFSTDLERCSPSLRKYGYTPALEIDTDILLTSCVAWLQDQALNSSSATNASILLVGITSLRFLKSQTWWAPCLTRLFNRHTSAHHATKGALRYARLNVLKLPLLEVEEIDGGL